VNSISMGQKRSRVYAVGETVFDIIFQEYQPEAAKPGGSAFNAMISLGRLGVPSSFISEVGNDRIGHYIREFLLENGVENSYVVQFENGKSALSLAFLDENGDASYDFYKDYPAQRLNETFPVFTATDYLLFGSFYGLNPVLRPQMHEILEGAQSGGSLIYYDPNFRASHLDELEMLRPIIEENFQFANVVRASDEDLKNIYGVDDVDDAWSIVSGFCDTFIYTANAHGVHLRTHALDLHIGVDQIVPVSTIGAGDTFNAGVVFGLHRAGIRKTDLPGLTADQWKEILQRAAAFSKEVCLSFDNYISPEFAAQFKNG